MPSRGAGWADEAVFQVSQQQPGYDDGADRLTTREWVVGGTFGFVFCSLGAVIGGGWVAAGLMFVGGVAVSWLLAVAQRRWDQRR